MANDPREYDKNIEVVVDRHSRRRLGIDTDRETVTRFVVQLEYRLDPLEDEWATAVRYGHDSEGSDEATHGVTKEGGTYRHLPRRGKGR